MFDDNLKWRNWQQVFDGDKDEEDKLLWRKAEETDGEKRFLPT